MESRITRSLITILLVSTVLLPAAIFKSSGAVTWSSPAQVPMNTTLNTNPSVTEDNLGRLWLVYQSTALLASPKIYYKVFNGLTWTAEQTITSDPNKNIAPAILTLNNGTLLVAWTSNRTGTKQVFYKTNNGGIWSQDTQLVSSTAIDTDPNLAQDATGRIWVVWERDIGSTANIYYLTIQGSTKSPVIQLTTDTAPNVLPSITVGLDGKTWITWSSLRTGNYEIWYTILSAPGAPHVELQLTNDKTTDQNPDVVQARDGSTYIVWSKEIKVATNVFESDLFYQVTTDNGLTWSLEVALTSSLNFDDFAPSVVQRSDNRLWLFWTSDMPAGTDFNIFYEFSSQIQVHNLAVTSLVATPITFPQRNITVINATIADRGDFSETTTFTITANSTTLLSNTVTLSVGQTQNIIFSWNTTTYNPGCYLVKAALAPVPGETVPLQADDSMTLRLHILYRGDLNMDGVVNIIDVAILAAHYATTAGSPNFLPAADLDRDGVINIIDLAILANNYGKSIPLC